MDQGLVASIALAVFSVFVVVAYIFNEERKSRKPRIDVHSGPDDLETRARRWGV